MFWNYNVPTYANLGVWKNYVSKLFEMTGHGVQKILPETFYAEVFLHLLRIKLTIPTYYFIYLFSLLATNVGIFTLYLLLMYLF